VAVGAVIGSCPLGRRRIRPEHDQSLLNGPKRSNWADFEG